MNDDIIKDLLNYDYSSLASYLSKLTPTEFATLGSLIGIVLIPSLSINEQSAIGNFLELIGQVLLASSSLGECKNPDLQLSQFVEFKNQYNKDLAFIFELLKKK